MTLGTGVLCRGCGGECELGDRSAICRGCREPYDLGYQMALAKRRPRLVLDGIISATSFAIAGFQEGGECESSEDEINAADTWARNVRAARTP